MMYYGPGTGGTGYLLMTLNMVLFWALIAAGVVAVLRYLNRSSRTAPRAAEAVLAERFGRGEIDEEEYQHRLRVLRSTSSRPTAP